METQPKTRIPWPQVASVAAIALLGLGLAAAVARGATDAAQPAVQAEKMPEHHGTVIHVKPDVGTLDTGKRGPQGQVISAPCGSCHKQHSTPPFARSAEDLKEFHAGFRFKHGNIACGACHDLQDRDQLRLADDRRISMSSVIELCSQCHGPQARDYAHGAHGGMNGYWDLRRGDRVRNVCVDCHNPHVPAYPQFAPVQRPGDRFLDAPAPAGGHHE